MIGVSGIESILGDFSLRFRSWRHSCKMSVVRAENVDESEDIV